MPLTAKIAPSKTLKPKASTTGAFSLDLQEGDRLHFLSDCDCEIRRGDQVLGRHRYAYDDEPLSKAVQRTQMALVPGMEAKVKGPDVTSMGKKDDGPPAAPKAKAPKKPEPPPQQGERWITIHPGGGDDYVRIKIRQHSDGTASVISGAGGKLNQLRLTKLKTPEEWKANAADRKAKREEKEKKRVEAQGEDEQAQEADAIATAREYHRGERHSNALETLKALDEAGIDLGLSDEHRDALAVAPSADTDPEEAKQTEALAREALKTVQAVQQAYEHKLINDHDARAAAKLGDTALDGLGNVLQEGQTHTAYSPGVDGGEGGAEVSNLSQLPNGEWLVRSPKGADLSFDNWEQAAKAHAGNVAAHDGTVGERSQPDDFYNPKLWVRQNENLPEGFEFKPEAAGKIAALAQQRKEIDRGDKNAEKAIKKGMPWAPKKGADVQGTEITEQSAIASLEADAKNIEDAIVHGRLLDLAGLLDPKAMRGHLTQGGLAQLGEIASDVLKANPVDPALVQQLGHNEAAKLLAYQIKQGVTAAEYKAIAAAQAAYHGQWSTEYAQQVIDQNQPLVDQLSTIHQRMQAIESSRGQASPLDGETPDLFGNGGDEQASPLDSDYTPDQLIELDNLAYQSRSLQDSMSKNIGTALGQMQASAAMTLALESGARSLRFSVNGENADVADVPGLFSSETPEGEQKPSIWAHYGLGPDDFSLEDGPDGQLVSVKPSGMEKLAGATYDPADRADYDRAIAIKRGEFDEENFTPAGFAYRPANTFTDLRAEAEQFDTKLAYESDMTDDALDGAIRQYLGARVANGDNPVSVRNDLFSPELYTNLGLGESDSDRLRAAVDKLDRGLFTGAKVAIADVRRAYQELGDHEAARQGAARATDDMQALHSQSLDSDSAKEAAHRTLAAMPMAKAAMKPLDQLTPRERKYLREQAITEIMGEELAGPESEDEEDDDLDAEEIADDAEDFVEPGLMALFDDGPKLTPGQNRAITRLKAARESAQNDAQRLFDLRTQDLQKRQQNGEISPKEFNDRWAAIAESNKQSLDARLGEIAEYQRKIEAGEVEPKEAIKNALREPTQWRKFSKLMGSDAKAYEAIRDRMKGQFYNRFASAYGAIQGKPLLSGRETLAHVDRVAAAMLPQQERENFLAHLRSIEQSDQAKARGREGGRFAVEVDDWLERYNAMKGGDRQISLLTTETKEQGDRSQWQRTTLGTQAEQQLDQAMAEVMPGFEQIDSAVNLYPEVRWNGGFVAHQRGLKLLQERKKIGMHYSAGAGKTSGMLGAFTHLHDEGVVQRSIVAVPSNTLGQIVGECATFLEPGKYNYSANIGWDREKRIAALKDPALHLHFSTRESLSNDLLYLVEKHTGVGSDDFQNTDARTEGDRRALMLTALQNEGIDPKSLLFTVDEAHDLSRRKGVAPSKRSLALDALAYHSSHYIHATGSPLKNDVSEIGDFLQKIGAPEAEDMAGFMARYGKNTQANTRALQRITAKYAYAVNVKPTTKDGQDLSMRKEKPRIPLTEYQKSGRSALLGHYETVKSWKDRELPKAIAAKVARGDHSPLNGADLAHAWDDPGVREAIAALASENYSTLSDEQKKAAIGGRVIGAAALRYTALNRLYHNVPYEHNAKAQHAVKMAKDMVAQGKPGVIFCASAQAAKMLHEQMGKEGLRVGYVDGSLSPDQKDRERLRFSPNKGVEPETDIFIVTDAMQTGANLQRGKFMAHFDVPITQKAWEQRSARIYRRGQTEDVEVHTLMADAPEDEIALARMERKGSESGIFQGYDATRGHAEVLDDSGLAGRIADLRSQMSRSLPQAA